MASSVIEGWEDYTVDSNPTAGEGRWFTEANSPTIRNTSPRTGSQHLEHLLQRITSTDIPTATEWGFHVAIYDASSNTQNTTRVFTGHRVGCGVFAGDNNGVFVRRHPSDVGTKRYQLVFNDGGDGDAFDTVLLTTTESFPGNTWVSHDVVCNGTTVSWRVNGALIGTAALPQAFTASRFSMRNGEGTERLDDIFVRTGAGSSSISSDFIIPYVTVNGDLTDQDWVPSNGGTGFDDIAGLQPDDASFIEATNVNDVSAFTFATPPDDIGQVLSVALKYRASKIDAGTSQVTPSLQVNGSGAAGAARTLTQSVVRYEDIFDTNPNGNVPWTPGDVPNLEVSFERTI